MAGAFRERRRATALTPAHKIKTAPRGKHGAVDEIGTEARLPAIILPATTTAAVTTTAATSTTTTAATAAALFLGTRFVHV